MIKSFHTSLLFLFLTTISFSQPLTEANKITALSRKASAGFGNSIALEGEYAIISASGEDIIGTNTTTPKGAAYVFKRNQEGKWIQMQRLISSDRATYDIFGSPASISGKYAVIAAPGDGTIDRNLATATGAVYVFERDENDHWVEKQKLVSSDVRTYDGFAVNDISGDFIIVGSADQDYDADGNNVLSSAGAAYIFERGDDNAWREVQKIVASDRSRQDDFGYSVAISGNYAVVGASQKTVNSRVRGGAAYIFKRDENGIWQEVQKIIASDVNQADEFGVAVDIFEDQLIVGTRYGDEDTASGNSTLTGIGSAYIFERNASDEWVEVKKLIASDAEVSSSFGLSLSISEHYAMVGAIGKDKILGNGDDSKLENAGAVYIFTKNTNGDWVEIQKLTSSDISAYDRFGNGIAIYGDQVMIGASGEDEDIDGGNTILSSGSVYTFEPSVLMLSNDSPVCSGSNVTFTATAGWSNYEFFSDSNTNGQIDAGESLQKGASNIYITSTLSNNDTIKVLAKQLILYQK
ncbi:MAG: FG-GAP repeat protein [Bacteroidota bacterium]